jgi:hypothetical protein
MARKSTRVSVWLFLVLAGAALAVALVINYFHAVSAYRSAGFAGWHAWLAGAVPDILMAAGSTLVVSDSRSGRLPRRWLPWVIVALGGALSLGINGWVAVGAPGHWAATVALFLSPTAVVLVLAPLVEDALAGLAGEEARRRPVVKTAPVAKAAPVAEVKAASKVEAEGAAVVLRSVPSGEGPWSHERARSWALDFRAERGVWPTRGELARVSGLSSEQARTAMRPLKEAEAKALSVEGGEEEAA